MGIAVVGTPTYLQNGGTSTTQPLPARTVAAGSSLILLTVAQGASAAPTAIVPTSAGATWVNIAKQATPSAFVEVEMWWCQKPPAGSTTVSQAITVVGVLDSTSQGAALWEFSGVASVQGSTKASGSSVTPAVGTGTPQWDGSLVFAGGAMFGGTGPTASPSAPWVDDAGPLIYTSNNFIPAAYQIQGTRSGVAASWTQATQVWAAIQGVFLPIAPPPPTPRIYVPTFRAANF